MNKALTEHQNRVFVALLVGKGLPKPEREKRFHSKRKWQFDFAFPEKKLAVEIEGGLRGNPVKCHKCGATVKKKLKSGKWIVVTTGGRHNSPEGFKKDCEKYNTAALLGWRVLRIPRDEMHHNKTIRLIKETFETL